MAAQPTERPGGSWNCPKPRFALHSRPSRTNEHPGGSSRAPISEFGHLLGIHKLTGHPKGSLELADIRFWLVIRGWKAYRTSGRFLESAYI